MEPRLNTMLPGTKPTSVPSGILIHPAVWPQYTNVTDRQTGQRSRIIGQTVTCNDRTKMTINKLIYLEVHYNSTASS